MFIHEIVGIFKDKNGALIVLESGKKIKVNVLPIQLIDSLKKHFIRPAILHHYKLPILIQDTWLQPTLSLKNKECEFINLFKITKIVQKDYGSQIYFKNYSCFISFPTNLVYRYKKRNIDYKLRISYPFE